MRSKLCDGKVGNTVSAAPTILRISGLDAAPPTYRLPNRGFQSLATPLRIAKRLALPGELPPNVRARASMVLDKETGERYGLVRYADHLEALEALHETIHVDLGHPDMPGQQHHPFWHFCAQVGSERFRFSNRHSTAAQRKAARNLLKAFDGERITI